MATYSVDDEFGNEIMVGLENFGAAQQVARRYLSAHRDAPCVTIYTSDGSEAYEFSRDEIL
jgi:hypothetical protein